MTTNTLVGNGEDDYTITFSGNVRAVGLSLLTNSTVQEIVTLYDRSGALVGTANLDPLTAPNTRVFVAIFSAVAFRTFRLDTVGGAVQNEGIEGLSVGLPVPEPTSGWLWASAALSLCIYQRRDRWRTPRNL
jgi:hypothetical protein